MKTRHCLFNTVETKVTIHIDVPMLPSYLEIWICAWDSCSYDKTLHWYIIWRSISHFSVDLYQILGLGIGKFDVGVFVSILAYEFHWSWKKSSDSSKRKKHWGPTQRHINRRKLVGDKKGCSLILNFGRHIKIMKWAFFTSKNQAVMVPAHSAPLMFLT